MGLLWRTQRIECFVTFYDLRHNFVLQTKDTHFVMESDTHCQCRSAVICFLKLDNHGKAKVKITAEYFLRISLELIFIGEIIVQTA